MDSESDAGSPDVALPSRTSPAPGVETPAWHDPWDWYARRLPPTVSFFLPIFLFLLPAAVCGVLLPAALAKLISLLFLSIVGVDLAVSVGIFGMNFVWWIVLFVVAWAQFFFLIWIVRNLELFRRWRRVNEFLTRRELKASQMYERHRWLRRFHFLGIALVVFMPFGTGVFVGIFLGKFTGMADRRLVGAVYLGTITWITVLVWLGYWSEPTLREWLDRLK